MLVASSRSCPCRRASPKASIALPATGTAVVAGDWAQFGQGQLTSYKSMTSTPGELMPFGIELETDGGFVVSGKVGAPLASRTTSGLTGTAVALTGPAARGDEQDEQQGIQAFAHLPILPARRICRNRTQMCRGTSTCRG